MPEQLQILDSELSAILLTNVDLEVNQLQALEKKGIMSIGDVYGLQAEGIAVALDIEFSKAEEIWGKVLKVVSNPKNWSASLVVKPVCDLPQEFIVFIDSFFENINKPRLYTILVRRFGLDGNRKYTLEEISTNLHDITRERVRQLEAVGLRLLREHFFKTITQESLFENENVHSQINNQIRGEVHALKQLFVNDIEPTRSEKDIFEIIQNRYENTTLSEKQKAHLRLLFEIYGWKQEENVGENSFIMLSFWVIHGEFKTQTIVDAAKQIIKFLQVTVVRTSYWDIKIGVNKRQKNKYTDLIIRTAIKLTPDIQALGDDYFQVAFSRLRTVDQAYRVLYEFGRPTGYRDICREISHKLATAGEDIPASRTIRNRMTGDKKRFVAIGKSEWALSGWDNVVSSKIIDLMVEFFHKKDSSAKPREVYDYVRSKRHVNESSVSWYLGDSDKFIGIGSNLYQLAEWGDSKNEAGTKNPLWSKQRTAELIVSIFDKNKVDVMPVNMLVAEMQKTMKRTSDLYLTLRKCPALKLSVVSESPRRLEAIVVRNFSFDELPTKQEKAEEAIRTILRKQPEHTMRLVELRNVVSKKWNINPQNVYGYVSKMIDVQKLIVEGSKTALVTLITEKEPSRKIPDIWDNTFIYDVAISYAGSNRVQAAELAKKLRAKGLRVFYDRDQIPDLIGHNLLDQLWIIYRDMSQISVILGSQSYNESDYAQHERKAAQDRAFKDPGYIILVKCEAVELNFFASTFEYLDWNEYGADKIAEFTKLQLDKRLNNLIKRDSAKMMSIEKDNKGNINVLFLAADPTNASRLRLGEEFREIQEQLKLAKLRDHFRLELPQLSIRPTDVSQALLDTTPQIVHFSGHGASTGALCFENQVGEIQLVEADALAALFEQFSKQVNCVLLNACYSDTQAKAIGKHIQYVIGMNQAIGDKAAIAFAIGFYQGLGAGRTIEESYKLGCVQIRLQGIPEHLTPVFIERE